MSTVPIQTAVQDNPKVIGFRRRGSATWDVQLFVSLVYLVSIYYYDLRVVNSSLKNYSNFILAMVMLILAFPVFFRRNKGFDLPAKFILFSVLFSILMSVVAWDQSIGQSIKATAPYTYFSIYFYLISRRFPPEKLEDILLVFGLTYSVLFFYQLLTNAIPAIVRVDEFIEERGIVRVIFPGLGVFYLAVFMGLCRMNSKSVKGLIWGLMALLGVVVTVLQVTRQSYIAVFLILLFHFTRRLKPVTRYIAMGALTSLIAIFLASTSNPLVRGLIEDSKKDKELGTSNVRLEAAKYYAFEFQPGPVQRLFGNGVPYALESTYARRVNYLEKALGFYLTDIGLVAVYFLFGLLPVFSFLLIWLIGFRSRLEDKWMYPKYFLFFLLITSLTSDYIYSVDFLSSTAIALYIFQVRRLPAGRLIV